MDWKSISGNSEVAWTPSMLEVFKDRMDWTELSSHAGKKVVTSANLEKFKNYWNWSELSGNTNFNLTEKIIDKYIDLWDWQKLIDRYYYDEDGLFSIDFF